MKTRKTNGWLIALTILLLITVAAYGSTKYIQATADPETVRLIAVFLEDFTWRNIGEMPSKQIAMMDNIRYYLSPSETWKP